MNRKAIAQDTLNILKTGYYLNLKGTEIKIGHHITACVAATKYYDPDSLSTLETEVLSQPGAFSSTEFEVRNETTLMGAERMARSLTEKQIRKIAVLNFASAKNPGGGFLNGVQAQEESLARSSALYPSLLNCPQYYEFHRANRSLLYSNRMIYSPGCPVFRKDDGTLLETPYRVDFITSAAPNAGMIARNQPEDMNKIPEVLRDRGAKILSLAASYQCDVLILGAWGCGVFRNDPAIVAQMFGDYLLPNGQFANKFKTVLFSVLDTSKQQNIINEFKKRFPEFTGNRQQKN